MAFDLDMIMGGYARMQERVKAARKIEGRPLTLAERITYPQLWKGVPKQMYKSRKSCVDVSPFCDVRQDARAHIALL